jgi:hypothetical protein
VRCLTFWGSHGCVLPAEHEGMHLCVCCPIQDVEHLLLHAEAGEDSYGVDGCAGNWPYYGAAVMDDPEQPLYFFDGDFNRMPDEFNRLRGER